jgi:hypothetical protein
MSVSCTATSDGGQASQQVVLKRDATPPGVTVVSPEPRVYSLGEQASVSFSCTDSMSQVASCVGTQANGASLNTAAAGTFNVTVTAQDFAGNSTTRTVSYTVQAAATGPTVLSLVSTPDHSSPQLNVDLRASVSPAAATGSVEFRDAGVLLGSAPLVNGVATLTVKFAKGPHPLTASYAGDANFGASSGSTTHHTSNASDQSVQAQAAKALKKP